MVLFPKFIGEFISRGLNIKTHLKLPTKLIMINLTTHFSCGQRGVFSKNIIYYQCWEILLVCYLNSPYQFVVGVNVPQFIRACHAVHSSWNELTFPYSSSNRVNYSECGPVNCEIYYCFDFIIFNALLFVIIKIINMTNDNLFSQPTHYF